MNGAPGIIRNRDNLSQVRSFRGMVFGTVSPTDIDGFFEIADRVYVFIETKFKGKGLSRGQELAFERLTDAIAAPRRALFIIACHEQDKISDIDVAGCAVVRYRSRGQWKPAPQGMTVRQLTEKFIEWAQEIDKEAP